MSGIREAQAGFLGMSNALTAMTVGLGLAVIAGKSAVDIAEKHEKAERNLRQAVDAIGASYSDAQKFLDGFIASHRDSVRDQGALINAYGELLRAGIPVAEAQKDITRALNISAITGRDYEEVIQRLILAEHGRLKGLSDLGVTTTKFIDAEGNLVASSRDVAKALAEVDAKTKDGDKSLTDVDRASIRLGNDWQDIANNVGPPLIGLLDGILRGTDWVIQNLKALGADKSWNETLSAGFGQIQNFALPFLETVKGIVEGIQWLANQGQGAGNPGQIAGALRGSVFAPYKGAPGKGGRIAAAGGFEGTVYGPTLFMAGEAGKEDVSIRPQGASGGSAGPVQIYINAGYIDGPTVDRLANVIALRLGYATGR